jgi:hypothetical protein
LSSPPRRGAQQIRGRVAYEPPPRIVLPGEPSRTTTIVPASCWPRPQTRKVRRHGRPPSTPSSLSLSGTPLAVARRSRFQTFTISTEMSCQWGSSHGGTASHYTDAMGEIQHIYIARLSPDSSRLVRWIILYPFGEYFYAGSPRYHKTQGLARMPSKGWDLVRCAMVRITFRRRVRAEEYGWYAAGTSRTAHDSRWRNLTTKRVTCACARRGDHSLRVRV